MMAVLAALTSRLGLGIIGVGAIVAALLKPDQGG